MTGQGSGPIVRGIETTALLLSFIDQPSVVDQPGAHRGRFGRHGCGQAPLSSALGQIRTVFAVAGLRSIAALRIAGVFGVKNNTQSTGLFACFQ